MAFSHFGVFPVLNLRLKPTTFPPEVLGLGKSILPVPSPERLFMDDEAVADLFGGEPFARLVLSVLAFGGAKLSSFLSSFWFMNETLN